MEEQQETTDINPAHILARKLRENKGALHISRVPEKTKDAFITLAEEEFCGDYGMTLKWLVDDILGQDTRMIIGKLEEHEARIQKLESIATSIPATKPGRKMKMLDGSIKDKGEKNHE